MVKKCLFPLALILCSSQGPLADTIQLKDKAAVTGRILTEKPDQIVVDIGYTALVIPRAQVLKITKANAAEPAVKKVANQRVVAEADPKPDSSNAELTAPGF